MTRGFGLDLSGSGKGPVADSCGQVNELPDSINCWDILSWLNYYWLLKNDSAPWSLLVTNMITMSYNCTKSHFYKIRIPHCRCQINVLSVHVYPFLHSPPPLLFEADGLKSRQSQWDPSFCPTPAEVCIEHLLDARCWWVCGSGIHGPWLLEGWGS
jgi:hypothetical protein